MEKIESLQEKIDKTEYWDIKILDFQINFLGDEVSMWIYNEYEKRTTNGSPWMK